MSESVLKGGFLEKMMIKLNAPGLKNKTNFFRLMAISQKAGLGIRDSLISIKQSETHRGLRMIIDDLINQMTQGESLASAMENHDYFFGYSEIELIRSSQITGNLPDVLGQVAAELENTQNIKQNIKKAITYPLILIIFSIIAVIVLLVFVIPNIVSMFPSKDQLPSITILMLDLSDFLQKTWYAVIITIFAVVFGIQFLYKYFLPFKIFIDGMSLKIPAVNGVIKAYYMYRFCSLLSQFYQAGVNPVVSLKLMSRILTNFYYKKKMIEIKDDLGAGFGYYDSMEGSDLFDPILIQIINVGENTGTIGESMGKISMFYDTLLKSKIAILMSVLEPILMACIAVIIGGIVASIFLPMAELVNVM
ncbi:type II secretion system F family protein [Candidatus Gracilibacteria bacterium]|nr:type II secretion system F family protein [Candidatus Gracilibacteria bacterium]